MASYVHTIRLRIAQKKAFFLAHNTVVHKTIANEQKTE